MLKLNYRKMNQEYNDLKEMQKIYTADSVSFEKAQKIKKEQQKKYDHYQFLIKLSEEVKKCQEKEEELSKQK